MIHKKKLLLRDDFRSEKYKNVLLVSTKPDDFLLDIL